MEANQALLSNQAGYTVFRFGGRTIRFRAPYSLERYTRVKTWDAGYLVVDAKYKHNVGDEEEYIDLTPVLRDLYIDPATFLPSIKGVRIEND
ncbi:MAG: hypothetical protein IJQ33_01855 [Clostridia bacterium]|nr:hypothetical protein [Clostridia bacterium]